VSVISTGSEIVEPGEPLGKGRIRNSNGPMLMNMVKAEGCDARYLGIAGDTEGELERKIERGSRSDVILLSGGVSMGDYDLVPAILKKAGSSIIFHKVSVKPGKPLLFAKRERCIIFGIPGNPVSNFTTFHLFVKPALGKLMGDPFHEISLLDAVSEIDIENRGDRVHVMPSLYTVTKGGIYVKPLKLNGSADIVGCAAANCLSVLKGGGTRVERGETVKILILK
jgi:molybdopterin molybdotransferase